MILADKIIFLRKKAGWSQEELAERLNVTRQSVSKWESAQSTPDLDRILELARLFDVSTDYLLKDEYDDTALPGRISDAENPDSDTAAHEEKQPLRRVSMEEANEFLAVMRKYSSVSANAFAMYVVSPVVLLTLGGLTERRDFALSENSIAVIGIVFLLLCVAAATVLLIGHSQAKEHFAYLEKEDIDTEYGVDGLAREYRQTYEEQYRNGMMCGVGICILAAVPSICIALLPEEWGLGGMMVSLTLVMIACAVRIFA
ncbi:MAG: helix-turn-helix domain-containing protein [Eubacteriales bacterium]